MINATHLSKRNSTLDIVRIASVLLVMMVHFFLYTGFYREPMVGPTMFLMCFMRTFFSACVPMFLILSGYLMSKKAVSKKHYFGISKTLLTYFVAGIACIVFNSTYKHTTYTFKSIVLSFFDFTSAQYAWYIEMYIGLFLLIPFLNLIYNNLKTKRHKQLLVITMVLLTAVPTLFNVYNLSDPSWWANPSSSSEFNPLLPDWWIGFYPVTFYFTGCYLREFGLKLKTKTLVFLLILTTLLFAAFNFWRSYGTGFITSYYAYWYGFQPYVTTILLFELLTRIKCDNTPQPVRFVLWKVSDLVLCMYLVSYIFDTMVYKNLCAKVPVMQDRIWWFLPCVLLVFISSLLSSLILSYVEQFLKIIYNAVVKFVKELKSKDAKAVQDICFMILMAATVVLYIFKAPLGFGGNDEAFYLTVAHRLGLGDTLFADEWHLSQMSGFITMPLVWLYRLIAGTTDGILLTFRYLYVILHGAVTVFAYKRLRNHGYPVAFGLALYFLYTPYNIMALSYNTMALDLLLLSGVLLSTSKSDKMWQFMLSGVCLAGAVLCCPYLAVLYLLYALCVVIHLILKKSNVKKLAVCNDIFSPATFLWFTLGVCVLAAIFAIFLLCTSGIDSITQNLPLMLKDPEHPQIGVLAKLKGYFNGIYNCHNQFKVIFYSYLATVAIMAVDTNRRNHRAFYLIISALLSFVCLIMFYPKLTTHNYNAIMMPMIFVGITSYILCERKPQAQFMAIFMTGIVYSICITMSSNQYFYVISMASALTNIGSFVFLSQLLREMKERPDEVSYGEWLRKSAIYTISFVIFILALFQIQAKVNHCFWESSPKTLTEQITTGPAKGICTTYANKETYESISQDLEYYDNVENDNILMLTERTWCYLKVEDMPYGTFSAWISGENDTALSRLEQFYAVNPDKVPTYIYIPKNSQLDTNRIVSIAMSKGYKLTDNNSVGYKLQR